MPEVVSHDGVGWPVPPEPLSFGQVSLRFIRIFPGDEARGFVPYYHFRILNVEGVDIGRINFRVGDTKHVLLCAGHIGYEIAEPHRGHGFARQACRALAPFVRSIYETVIITCDPDNIASTRTIEQLGAHYLDEVSVAPEEPAYERGSRSKKRFRWKP